MVNGERQYNVLFKKLEDRFPRFKYRHHSLASFVISGKLLFSIKSFDFSHLCNGVLTAIILQDCFER